MIFSFLSLATTGLTLNFSYTRWAAIVSHLLGGFESAGNIHRAAAVVMFGVFITHLVDLYGLKKKNTSPGARWCLVRAAWFPTGEI